MFKDKKTTYVAIAAGIGFLVSVILVAIGKATLVEAGAYLGVYTSFLVTVLGIVTKDSNNGNMIPPKNKKEMIKEINEIVIETEQSHYVVIPGRGLKEPPPPEEEAAVRKVTINVTLENGEEHTLSMGEIF